MTSHCLCASRSTIFPGIFIFLKFRPRDMQEYIFMFSKLDLRPSNLQLMPWNFQIQHSYLLNRSSASNSVGNIWVSHLFTNKCIRCRNIAVLHAGQLQIWQLSIANDNTRYIIIALELLITTYATLLLFTNKDLSLLSKGNPSNFLISLSDRSIVSNWSYNHRT